MKINHTKAKHMKMYLQIHKRLFQELLLGKNPHISLHMTAEGNRRQTPVQD
jgi:hypothetical protein